MAQVPIVDFAKIGELHNNIGDDTNWKRVAGEIRESLSNIGFVYLKNHGIDKLLV